MNKLTQTLKNQLLLQYLFFGLILFLVAQWQDDNMKSKNTIHFSSEHQQNLIEEFKHEYHRKPNKEELEGLLADAIKQEVLLREAVKHKIDQHDEIIRRRMISKMGFIVQSIASVEPPQNEALLEYYNNHLDSYLTPATYSLRHLYFSDKAAAEDTMNNITQRAINFEQAKSNSNQFVHGDTFKHKTLKELNQIFGISFVKAIQQSEQHTQAFGPIASLYGYHIIQLDSVAPPSIAKFEDIRGQVYNDWFIAAKEVAQQRAYENLLSEYQINIETLPSNDTSILSNKETFGKKVASR